MADQNVITPNYPIDVAALSNSISGTKTWGPLTVTYSLDLSVPQVNASASLYGHTIDNIVLNPQNTTDTLGGSIGIAKAEVVLTADFTKKEIDYEVDVELFGKKLYDSKGILFTW
jgi:hypothetical protein